jgi:hypothetical protein
MPSRDIEAGLQGSTILKDQGRPLTFTVNYTESPRSSTGSPINGERSQSAQGRANDQRKHNFRSAGQNV